ncbi:30S ribosomal protein S20 [bacterium HR35]|nr:30S ribosomal protein S20 [bacterium HR35]
MPVTKSAKRALKKALRNWYFNERRRREIKIAVKNFLKAVKEKKKEEAKKYLALVYKSIDKGAKRFIHKNKAARLKAKYAKIFNQTFGENKN